MALVAIPNFFGPDGRIPHRRSTPLAELLQAAEAGLIEAMNEKDGD